MFELQLASHSAVLLHAELACMPNTTESIHALFFDLLGGLVPM